jgi:CheY-like chemotaxis protein
VSSTEEVTEEAVDEAIEPVSILLVDDRPSNLLALEGLLRRPEYDLVLARSGEEALAQVLRHELALILLDIAMPGMDGFQVAAMIKDREQSKHTPILFITASVYEMDHIFRRFSVGAVDYVRKPLDADAVRSKVAVFVELFRLRKQVERLTERLHEAERREEQLLRARAEGAVLPEPRDRGLAP